jgi:FkbH-like protein
MPLSRRSSGSVPCARPHSNAICIVQTIASPPEQLFGSHDAGLPGTSRRFGERFNQMLAESLKGTPDLMLDIAWLAQTVGLATWHSPCQWNLAKLPFDSACSPLYAEHVARLLAASLGRSRKCLVLDLDNTLWGGVIGDDGLSGIRVAQGDAVGEAHLAVQRLALDLRARGIVLAVCSKNEDETARIPFREHPEMLLWEDHLAVFQANWQDKVTNIASIANALSLGQDALVFLDDNPAEPALVREFLPDVAVPELPDDPSLYARTLAAAGYFESVAFSPEDSARADMYRSNARRVELRQVGSIDDWLASLQMEITFAPFDAVCRSRIVQLINKSNQFNLTTRRYNELDVERFERDPGVFTLQVRLADSLGDSGMISVVICRCDNAGEWTIDTWLMSCRVLGRNVETAVLREVLEQARAAGMTTLVGLYRPTGRNAIVEDHYSKLGFQPSGVHEDATRSWTLKTDAVVEAPPMVVRRAARALELV